MAMSATGHAVFRTDASLALGGGHVRRCLVLADALAEIGWGISFVCSGEAESIVPALRRRPYPRIDVAEFDRAPSACDLAVIDDYRLDAVFERSSRRWAHRILVIDDLANRPHDCNVLVDQSPGRAARDYAAFAPDGCELLVGPSYALLDPRFRAAPRRNKGPLARVFVNFGTTDSTNATAVALEALKRAKLGVAIDVVLGGAASHLEEIRAYIATTELPVSLHLDVDDIAMLMQDADVAIGAGGVGALERCVLGLPSLIITVADNQTNNALAFEAAGAAHYVGGLGSSTAETLAFALQKLCADAAARQAMSAAGVALADGLGAARVRTHCFVPPLAKDGRRVALRPATFADAEMMFAWQSFPNVRAFARNHALPKQHEHERWLRSKLADRACIFNVVMHGNHAAGVLRFDRMAQQSGYEASIVIAADRQGQGIGAGALELGKRLLPGERIVATIHPDNVASIRLFENAGYRPESFDAAGYRTLVLSPEVPEGPNT